MTAFTQPQDNGSILVFLPSVSIGPSSSHIETCGDKDSIISFSLAFFRGSPSILLGVTCPSPAKFPSSIDDVIDCFNFTFFSSNGVRVKEFSALPQNSISLFSNSRERERERERERVCVLRTSYGGGLQGSGGTVTSCLSPFIFLEHQGEIHQMNNQQDKMSTDS